VNKEIKLGIELLSPQESATPISDFLFLKRRIETGQRKVITMGPHTPNSPSTHRRKEVDDWTLVWSQDIVKIGGLVLSSVVGKVDKGKVQTWKVGSPCSLFNSFLSRVVALRPSHPLSFCTLFYTDFCFVLISLSLSPHQEIPLISSSSNICTS